MNIIDKNLKCNICQSSHCKYLFSDQDRMFPKIKDSYSLYQCKSCGLIFIYPKPLIKQLNRHYPPYYSVYSDSGEVKNIRKIYSLLEVIHHYINLEPNIPLLFKFFIVSLFPLRPFFRTTKFVKKGNFLDVGCGVGYFLLIMKLMGMETFGVEPGDFNKNLSQEYGLNIYHGDLFEARYKNEFFDVITLNHVLEHVYEPLDLMNELNRILKSEGHLIIGIPVHDSIAFKIFGKYWAQLDIPRHLNTFSINSLKKIANKTGFRIEKIRYNSTPTYQFLCSIKYFIDSYTKKTHKKSIIHNLFFNLAFLPLSTILNCLKRGDQCEVILRKVNNG